MSSRVLVCLVFLLCIFLKFGESSESISPKSLSSISSLYLNGKEMENLDMTKNKHIVWIGDGGLQGFSMKTIGGKNFKAFQKIPYAQPPIAQLRFKEGVKNSKWRGVRDAVEESPKCLQTDFFIKYQISGSEDCLYLNVYTPTKTGGKKLPVMVYIHGGGFFFGTSSIHGPAYMMEEDIVLVTINYRLGPLGFFSTGDEESPGNLGFKDQVLALKWVQENIENFNGDPNLVTIFGESAGASSVQFHMLSPLSKGLFHRGISQSGCAFCFWSISENGPQISAQFAKSLNCSRSSSQEMMNCLRNVDGKTLVSAQLQFLEWDMYPVVIFGPVIEPPSPHAFISSLPSQIYKNRLINDVPWLSGFNSHEGALNAASLLIQPNKTADLNKNWAKIGQTFLGISNGGEQGREIGQKIKDFYMGNKTFSISNRNGMIEMFSDRYVIMCGIDSMRHHAKYASSKVYNYILDYSGRYGFVQLVAQNPKEWGVSHLDDLIYLFNSSSLYPTLKLTDEEYTFSKLLISTWTHFARTGEGRVVNQKWESVSDTNLNSIQLSLKPSQISISSSESSFRKRIEFWNSLDLEELI